MVWASVVAAAGAVEEAISLDAMWRWVIICVVVEDGGAAMMSGEANAREIVGRWVADVNWR